LQRICPREYRYDGHVADRDSGPNDPCLKVRTLKPVLLSSASIDEEEPKAEFWKEYLIEGSKELQIFNLQDELP